MTGEESVRLKWLKILAISIPAAYAVIGLAFFNHIGRRDHSQFLAFYSIQYWNARLFNIADQWTPVMCGGLSIGADPQIPKLSLGMLLAYGLGPFYGLRVAAILWFVVGWAGAYAYSGLIFDRRLVRALAASLFIGNGFFVFRLSRGHIDFLPFLALPLILWGLHVATDAASGGGAARPSVRILLALLLLGGGLALMIDGSPVTIIHLWFWVAVYAVVLSAVRRSIIPLALVIGATSIAVALDALYLWPMVDAQRGFPRITPVGDRFTNPLYLLFFMLVPGRVEPIPATVRAHELSVFIGPAIAWAIWRYRTAVFPQVPRAIAKPWLVVALASLVLGMGSLSALGIPKFISPYDLLRPLPGFRSIGVTGRYWGFLALPLSMLGAAALSRLAAEGPSPRRLRTLMILVLLIQVGFQVESMIETMAGTRRYRPVPIGGLFAKPEPIEYVHGYGSKEGETITPTRGVIDCYDMGDFIRPAMLPGTDLVARARSGPLDLAADGRFTGVFVRWNEIGIEIARGPDGIRPDEDGRYWLPPKMMRPPRRGVIAGKEGIRLVLNQAYNRHWVPSSGRVSKGPFGNLAVTVSWSELWNSPLVLKYVDPVSERAVRVSATSWVVWAMLTSLVLVAFVMLRRAA
jgi:hypothetical protein